MSCEGCLLEGNTQVKYWGNLKANIMICGESPGNQELLLNRPFIGPAGKFAQQKFTEAGLVWPEAFIVNSARCLLDTKTLKKKEIASILASCRPNILCAVKVVKPKVIIAFGDIALQQLLGKTGIKKNRSKFFWSEELNCYVIATYHPSGCLRDPSRIPYFIQDLKKVAQFQKNKWKLPKEKERVYLESDPQGLVPVSDILAAADVMEITAAPDSETQGMDWMSPNTKVICYGISTEVGKALVVRTWEEIEEEEQFKPHTNSIQVPVGGKGKKAKEFRACYIQELPNSEQRAKDLDAILRHPNIKKYFCNGLYDLHQFREYLKYYGIEMKVVNFAMDVQAVAHLLDENQWKMASLVDLQFAFSTNESNYSQEFDEKYNKNLMIEVPSDDLVQYNAADCDVTLEVGTVLRKKLLEPGNERLLNYYVRFVQPTLNYTLYELGKNGSFIDKEKLPQAKSETAAQLQDLKQQIMDLIPWKVKKAHYNDGLSLTRGDLIKDTLFSKDGFGLKSKFKTPKGNIRFDDEAQKEMLEREGIPEKAKSFVKLYVEWQAFHKLYSTYLNSFEKHIKSDSRIHSSYSIVGTVTGRFSSQRPNMQNQPKRSRGAEIIRSLISSPNGKVLLALDAGQAELRWCAHVSRDKNMIEVFQNGEDIHTNTAESIIGKKKHEVDDKYFESQRFFSKAINFGIIYLISPEGFRNHCKNEFGIDIDIETAKTRMKIWNNTYPMVSKYHRDTISFCIEHGYVESPLGRRRRLPEITSNDWKYKGRAEKQAVNHPIQSASSDTVILAANTLIKERALDPEHCKLVNFVHDELVFEVTDKDSIIQECYDVIKYAMENPPLHLFGIKMRVPFQSDGKVGKNLAEMEKIS